MLLTLTMRALEIADQPLYIIPPRSRLLRLMGGIFLAWTVLLTITVAITAYVTIPLLVYLGYVFFLFARIWCSC